MKRISLVLAALVAPALLTACANPPAPSPAPMPSAYVAPAAPTSPVLASTAATQSAGVSGTSSATPAWQKKPLQAGELPAGHPPIGAAATQASQKKPLQPGELPAGHPPIGGMPNLPAGHPDIAQMQAARSASTQPASTQPATIGSLTVRAVQSTAGGPQIGELPVVIEFRQGEQVLDKSDAKLNAQGTLRVDDIPLSLAVTPIIRITYKGVEYSAAGNVLNSQQPDQHIQVPLYETTEEAPAWSVAMKHVMLEPSVAGVRVMEMLAVSNPADRAWIGKLGANNKRTTLTLALPQSAKDVQLSGGFHDCCVQIADGKLVDSMALLPGTSQYRLAYTLPVSDGKADVALTMPAPVKHFMIFLPDDGSKVESQGIAGSGVADMGGGKTRYFKATDLAAGANVTLSISGITAPAATAKATTGGRTAASASVAKLVAGLGGLAIFVVGGMLVMFKAPRARKA